jgi:hypothetical protein
MICICEGIKGLSWFDVIDLLSSVCCSTQFMLTLYYIDILTLLFAVQPVLFAVQPACSVTCIW